MKRAAVISIGEEIVNGWRIDTNSVYMSSRLFMMGLEVAVKLTCGDDRRRIAESIETACRTADIVLITGGLGPTADDLTRQAMADFLGVELVIQTDLLEQLEAFFVKRGIEMPRANKIQACLPDGAKAIVNKIGTAPGIRARKDNKIIFALPGVPAEMHQMLDEIIWPEIEKTAAQAPRVMSARKLKCFGAGESSIAQILGEILARGKNPLVNITASGGVITLYIIASADNKSDADLLADRHKTLILEKLGDLVYGCDEQTLAEVVGQKLADTGKTLALAESCTGGLISKMITDVPGSSRYFNRGWVTYSNEAKIAELGVDKELLRKYGAVSEQVACAMAKCARARSGADWAVSVTGIAGPSGGSEQKPVGLVYISIDSDLASVTKNFVFPHKRQLVRQRTAMTALNMLRMKLSH